MTRLLIALAVLLAMSGAALARTAPNPAAVVAQAESSGCVNNNNPQPGMTASGCFGFTNGTWSQYAPQAGVSLAQCPTAASCPVSDQFAVFAADVNSHGLADWTCPGCDATVSAAVNGGELPASGYNLSTNPADYAALDTPSGLQAYFSTAGASPTLASATGTGGLSAQMMPPATAQQTFGAGTAGAGALPPVSSTPGALSTPFTWIYQQVITATEQNVENAISQMQAMVGTYLFPLVTLALVSLLIRMLWGRYLIDHAAAWVAKLAVIVPLVAAGSSLYTQFVVGPIFGFPQWWQQYAISGGGQFNTTSPATIFDQSYTAAAATEQKIWSETHGLTNDVRNAVGLTAARVLIDLSLAALFLPFVILTLLSEVLVILGPVCIPFALFHKTSFLFWNWVWAVATILLSLLVIDIVLSMYSSIMTLLMQSMSVTGTADNDAVGFWGAALAMLFMGLSAAVVPALVTRIGTGVSVSMASASYFMSAGPIRDAGKRALNTSSTALWRWTQGL